MQISPASGKIPVDEIASNLLHGAVALVFGLITLAAAAHVVTALV